MRLTKNQKEILGTTTPYLDRMRKLADEIWHLANIALDAGEDDTYNILFNLYQDYILMIKEWSKECQAQY